MTQPEEFDVVLASASPRRRELLEKAGVRFRVHAVDVDESLTPDELSDPVEASKKLAERKAHAAVEQLATEDYQGTMAIIASDTIVALNGQVFGKPHDEADARRMLGELSGKTHQVCTGVSLWLVHAQGEEFGIAYRTFADVAHVTFKQLSDDEIDTYIETGDSFDKAGAYGIQGLAGAFVEKLDGSRDTVMGLPVGRLLEMFPELLG